MARKLESKWTYDLINKYRQQTDPEADRTVEAIYKEGAMEINELFHHLTRNRTVDFEILPDSIRDYFDKNNNFPDWVDWDKIALAGKVYNLYCPEICMLLFYKSLPATYSCEKGASVLVTTGRMVEHHQSIKMFTARLMETSQFVMDVMRPDAFGTEGKGVVRVLKVRLIHAAIRHFIRKSGHWDFEKLDEPINHQDMTGTLLSFSAFILEGLQEQGFELSQEEQDAYYHRWRLVGHFMGLPEELLVESYKESLDLGHSIINQQEGPSEPGVLLTKALVEFINETVKFRFLRNTLAESSIYYFAGRKTAKFIGIRRHSYFLVGLFWIFQRGYALLFRLFNRNLNSPVVRGLSKFNRKLLSGVISKFNENKQINYDMPPSLKRDWKT